MNIDSETAMWISEAQKVLIRIRNEHATRPQLDRDEIAAMGFNYRQISRIANMVFRAYRSGTTEFLINKISEIKSDPRQFNDDVINYDLPAYEWAARFLGLDL